MVLSFTIAASPRQRSHSQVQVPRDSLPHSALSDSPNLEGPIFISPRSRVVCLCPPGSRFHFRRLQRLVGLRWMYLTPPKSQSHVTTDGQSASLFWNKAPIWDLPDFYYCQTVASLLIWGTLSDERTGLSFTIAPGPCQCSRHFRVRLPWDS
jgi:hypothetical protein